VLSPACPGERGTTRIPGPALPRGRAQHSTRHPTAAKCRDPQRQERGRRTARRLRAALPGCCPHPRPLPPARPLLRAALLPRAGSRHPGPAAPRSWDFCGCSGPTPGAERGSSRWKAPTLLGVTPRWPEPQQAGLSVSHPGPAAFPPAAARSPGLRDIYCSFAPKSRLTAGLLALHYGESSRRVAVPFSLQKKQPQRRNPPWRCPALGSG